MSQSKSKNTPTRPKRVSQKPKTQMKPLTKVQSKFEENEIAKPTSLDTNKYAQQRMIGEPTIEAPGGMVDKVGLGGLKTVTNYGSQPDV